MRSRVLALEIHPPSTGAHLLLKHCLADFLYLRPSHVRFLLLASDFNPSHPRNFAFDAVFGENVTQEQVFEELASRIIEGCVDGYNGTIFAYGQTGSGKTHTMLGPHHVENFMVDSEQRGLIPRACEALFTKLCTRVAEKGENFKYEVTCKFVELYNEEFYDLLGNSQQKLSIRSDSKVVQLIGVSEHSVLSSVDMMRILEVGWDARRTAETAMNRESSRSHAIFIVEVKTEELINTIVNKKCATLNLVDLAGSERQTQAKTVGSRFKEAININLSLTVLGRVIRTLSSTNRGDGHVPYRDSKLTHILRDSLGGNSRTAVIVNLHPDKSYYTETLSTLQFSSACRKIENTVRANEDLSGDTVMAYKSEINRLREELQLIEERVRAELEAKIELVEAELKQWKEAAISREKKLVETQLQRDTLAAQLSSRPNNGVDVKSQEEALREVTSMFSNSIGSIKTFEDLTRAQLETDLSSALRELDHMRARYENAEAARKALNEKYGNVLEGYDETLGSPLRRLNLTATPNRSRVDGLKSAAQKKKERRQTMFTPKNANDRKSRAFRPVLFDDSVVEADQTQGNLELDDDMKEERELLRLEMDNNRLSQILTEKDEQIEGLYEKQKEQATEWLAEKEKLLDVESTLKAQVHQLQSERCELQEKLADERNRSELLCSKISTANDEKCRLNQEIDLLRSEKYDLEDRLQMLQNEQEQLSSELSCLKDVESTKTGLEEQLLETENQLRLNLVVIQDKTEQLEEASFALMKKSEEIAELTRQMEQYKMNIVALEETNARLEEELEDEAKILGRKYEEELKYLQAEVEAEQDAHTRTKAMLKSKDEELNHMVASLHAKNDEQAELQNQLDIYKEMVDQKEEATLKMEKKREEEVNKLKKRHADELKNVQSQVELEQNAHAKTRQQFSEFRQSAQETFEKKLAELRDTFSNKERRMTIDIDSREDQIMKLQAEKESLLQRYEELLSQHKHMQEELENMSKENEIFRSTKAQDDRALVELAGHNNHKQKVSYIEKVRLENYNLKKRIMELENEARRYQGLSARTRKDSNGSGPASRTRSARENNF
ncbi:hypothetical protein Y032_0434g1395 [Ancylostoma ceylanicum]|uniref:Kinesin motor domain-containing protein n=1 Tax=Ancylostoma ceylanicum TaxID=53326 RepID=A0A016X073_9BILA|nr:hypothetical protein Y032_0434g1395 [Ancylostoma ceylanicum]